MALSIKEAVGILSAVGYCLSGKVRPQLLDLLRRKPQTVGELAEMLELKQPLVSHHLGLMFEAGVLAKQRNGKSVMYAINGEKLSRLVKPLELLAAAPALPKLAEAEAEAEAEAVVETVTEAVAEPVEVAEAEVTV